jgi:hypothetical protein
MGCSRPAATRRWIALEVSPSPLSCRRAMTPCWRPAICAISASTGGWAIRVRYAVLFGPTPVMTAILAKNV